MSSEGLSIFRLVIAGVNGILFTLGVALIFEMVVRRPKRMRAQIRSLVARAEQLEVAGDTEAGELRRQVDTLKQQLQQHYNHPRSLLTIGFGILMIILALLSLVSLVAPPFAKFM